MQPGALFEEHHVSGQARRSPLCILHLGVFLKDMEFTSEIPA